MLGGADEVGRGQRVVDDERNAGFLGDGRDGGDVGDDAAGIGNRLDENRLGFRRDCRTEGLRIGGIGPANGPVALLERVGELVDRAAIELTRGDELIAWLKKGVEHEHLRRVTRGDGKPGGAAFERRDALL
jgi:hypothetical protein